MRDVEIRTRKYKRVLTNILLLIPALSLLLCILSNTITFTFNTFMTLLITGQFFRKILMSILLFICWLLSIYTLWFYRSLFYLCLSCHTCCSFLFCLDLFLSSFAILSVFYCSLLFLLCLYSIL